MTCRCLVAAAALLCITGVASAQFDATFESPTYSTGDLAPSPAGTPGQDGWYWYTIPTDLGVSAVQVISGDNGPTDPGTQCIEITAPTVAYPDGHIRIHNQFTDAAQQGPIVTFQYDFKWVNAEADPVPGVNFRPRVLDSLNGDGSFTGMAMSHSNAVSFDYYGSSNPDGSTTGFIGQQIGDMLIERTEADEWHTIKWVAYYGNQMGADYGQLLYGEIDGVRTPWIECFFPANVSAADLVQFRVLASGDAAVFRVDNLKVFGQTLPSALPTADAGTDQIDLPSTYAGAPATLPASGTNNSFDDGAIDHYMWSLIGVWPETKLGFDAVETALLPYNASGTARLTVIDNDGLVGMDTFDFTTQAPAPVPVDDVWGPFGIKRGDIYGKSQHPFVVPTENVAIELVDQYLGYADDPASDRQFVFDEASNLYYLTWYGTVRSLTADLSVHWESADLIGSTGENNMIIVGIRYVYVVGAQQDTNIGTVWALSMIDGSVQWTASLGETWPDNNSARGLMSLYNDKLYVVGVPTLTGDTNDPVNIYQVDASTGAIDWTSTVMVGSTNSRPGHILLVPDVYGTGLHGLFFAGRSEGEADGLSDTNGIQIDPSTGATLTWGIDAGAAEYSRMIYSDAAGRDAIYAVTLWNWAGEQFWSFDLNNGGFDLDGDPNTPIEPASCRGGDFALGHNGESAALSFDGMSVYCGNNNARVYKYIDDGTGQSITAEEYWFGIDEWDARSVAPLSVLMQDASGDEILVTTLGDFRWWDVDPNDPADDRRDTSSVVLLNMSTATLGGTEAELDDGPVYFDNIVIQIDGSPVASENFESYAEGTFSPSAPWSFTGTAGTEATARIVDLGAPHGKVLELNPYGGNSGDITAVSYDLGTAYNELNCNDIVVSWDQYRTDLTDNVSVGDEYSMFQWDGAGNPGDQLAWSIGVYPDWSLTAQLATETWEPCVMTLDYGFDLFDMTVAGTNNGETPPFLSTDGIGIDFKDTDAIRFYAEATPPTSSGYVRQPDVPLAEYQISTIINSVTFEQDWGWPDGLSIAPNGDIYVMQFKSYDRRYSRLRITGDSGPPYLCGDANGDGSADVFDIDAFVLAITSNEGDFLAQYPLSNYLNSDTNCDGDADVFDIDTFVGSITGTACDCGY